MRYTNIYSKSDMLEFSDSELEKLMQNGSFLKVDNYGVVGWRYTEFSDEQVVDQRLKKIEGKLND